MQLTDKHSGASPAGAKAPAAVRRLRMPRILQSRRAVFGMVVVLLFVLMSLLAPVLKPGNPALFVGLGMEPPSRVHPLGTLGFGQDCLAQVVWGGRMSLGVGFVAGLVATCLSVAIGMTAGYSRSWVGDVLSTLINVFLVMPGLPLAIVMAAYLPGGPVAIIAALSISGWSGGARVMRAQTISLREKDFISAALVSGESHLHIIFSEVMPNMTSLVVSNVIGATIYGIGAEVGLTFLGLGNISAVSWGTILYWARQTAALARNAWWAFVPAGLCVALVGFALTMINYGLDEITNPRLHSEQEYVHALKRFVRRVGRITPVVKRAG